MARFKFDERDDVLVADDEGNLNYHEALSAVVEQFSSQIEQLLWEFVDELEYVVGEEMDQPDNELPEDDDDNYVNPDPED